MQKNVSLIWSIFSHLYQWSSNSELKATPTGISRSMYGRSCVGFTRSPWPELQILKNVEGGNGVSLGNALVWGPWERLRGDRTLDVTDNTILYPLPCLAITPPREIWKEMEVAVPLWDMKSLNLLTASKASHRIMPHYRNWLGNVHVIL